jgi:putative toxin-antitoxin system antitoxin component (TIGR02293 family)
MASSIVAPGIQKLADLEALSQAELIEVVSRGLPAALAAELAKKLEVTREEMAGLLRLNPRTFQRRLDEGTLSFADSERLWELARLFSRAVGVLESVAGAVHWLKNPVQALGWSTPLAYARTVIGLREIEKVLGRIEHGVYS